MYKKEKKSTSEEKTDDIVELRSKSKSLQIDIKTKSEKYNSDGGTPNLEFKLSLDPKQFSIESHGMPTHGTQAQVNFAWIKTDSQNTIDIVKKKEKYPGDSSLNNEVEKSLSIKKHVDYEKIKNHLCLPFHTENRHSGQEIYLRLKKNGDLENYRNFIKDNSLEASTYLFHQTRSIVKTLNFLHNGDFLDEKEKKHKGIIHGDIKPDNILIDKNGNLSLSDFGCARYTEEPIEQPGLVTYLSPELLKIYTNMDEILSSDPGKSDIWSLGVTLKSVLTGTCPIESHNQAAIDAMNSMSRKTNGYFIREIKPTPVANQEVYTEELAEWVADLKLDWEIEQEPLQIKEFRTKVDAYLQSETCKNLESKKIIENLCQNLSHAKIDKSVVLGHLTSSMLLPEEQRPTAKNLSETMDKLAHYFPYDPKKNFEFVKKMIVEKDVSSLTCQKEINTHKHKKILYYLLSEKRIKNY